MGKNSSWQTSTKLVNGFDARTASASRGKFRPTANRERPPLGPTLLEPLESRLLLSMTFPVSFEAHDASIWPGVAPFHQEVSLFKWSIYDKTIGGYGIDKAHASLTWEAWADVGSVDLDLDGRIVVDGLDNVRAGDRNVPVTIEFVPDPSGTMSGYLGAGLNLTLDLDLDYNLPGLNDEPIHKTIFLEDEYNKIAPSLGLPKIPGDISFTTDSGPITPSFGSAFCTDGFYPLLTDLEIDVLKLVGNLFPAVKPVDAVLDLNVGADLGLTRKDCFTPEALSGTLFIDGSPASAFSLTNGEPQTVYVNIPETNGTSLEIDIGNLHLENRFRSRFGVGAEPYLGVELNAGIVSGTLFSTEFDLLSFDFYSTPVQELDVVESDPAPQLVGAGVSSMKLLSPNGGEILQRGTSQEVQWRPMGFDNSTVDIRLYRGSFATGNVEFVREIAIDTPDDGRFNWSVPDSLQARGDYWIEISHEYGWHDRNDSPFSIVTSPPVAGHFLSVSSIQLNDFIGNRNNVAEDGEIIRLKPWLIASQQAENARAMIYCNDPQVVLLSDTWLDYWAIFTDSPEDPGGWFRIKTDLDLEEGEQRDVLIGLKTEYEVDHQPYYQDLQFAARITGAIQPSIEIVAIDIDDSLDINSDRNNGDGIWQSGEEVDVRVTVRNTSAGTFKRLVVTPLPPEDAVDNPVHGNLQRLEFGTLLPNQANAPIYVNDRLDLHCPTWFSGHALWDLQVEWSGAESPMIVPSGLDLVIQPAGWLTVTAERDYLGISEPGDDVLFPVSVRNDGSAPIEIHGFEFHDGSGTKVEDVSASPSSLVLLPGEQRTIQMTLRNDELWGAYARELTVIHNGRHRNKERHDNVLLFNGVMGSSALHAIPNSVGGQYPDASGDWIVWGQDGNIHAYNMLTTEQRLISHSGCAERPKIDYPLIAWRDSRNYGATGWDIYALDMESGSEFVVSAEPGEEWLSGVAFGRIAFTSVYYTGADGSRMDNLFIYDHSLGSLAPATTPSSLPTGSRKGDVYGDYVDFCGNMLVWYQSEQYWDSSRQEWRVDSSTRRIFVRRIGIDATPVMIAEGHAAQEGNCRTDGDRVIWLRDDANGDCQIAEWRNGATRQLTPSDDTKDHAEQDTIAIGNGYVIHEDMIDSRVTYCIDANQGGLPLPSIRVCEGQPFEVRMDGLLAVWMVPETVGAAESILWITLFEPDLSIASEEMRLSSVNPQEGDTVNLTAVVRNGAEYGYSGALAIEAWLGAPDEGGVLLANPTQNLAVPSKGNAELTVSGIILPENPNGEAIYDSELYLRILPGGMDPGLNNIASMPIAIRDDDVAPPAIKGNAVYEYMGDGHRLAPPASDADEVAEYLGDGDGIIGADEGAVVRWQIEDESEIRSLTFWLRKKPSGQFSEIPVERIASSASVTMLGLAAGDYEYEIRATDNDNSPESTVCRGEFKVVPAEKMVVTFESTLAPRKIDLGKVPVGGGIVRWMTIRNDGGQGLLVDSIKFEDDDMDRPGIDGVTIPPGGSLEVPLAPLAQQEKPLDFLALIDSSDSSSPYTVQITGEVAIPRVSVTVSPSQVREDGEATLVYTFTRDIVTSRSMMVNFSVSGSAVLDEDYAQDGAEDYTVLTGTIEIPADESSAAIEIDPIEESIVETDETVILSVIPGTGYVSGYPASATATILEPDNTPQTVDDRVTTAEDPAVALTIDVLANDSDPNGDPLSLVSHTEPRHGTMSREGFIFSYKPDDNFNGTDSFTYTVSDGYDGFDTATVTINVTPINDRPEAFSDSVSMVEDATQIGMLSGFDVDGDSLVFSLVQDAAHGTVSVQMNGAFTYTPEDEYSGVDTFSFRVRDGSLYSDPTVVTISVNAVNDPPNANDDEVSTQEDAAVTTVDVRSNDIDPDGDSLAIVSFTQPAHGHVTHNGEGSFTYIPSADFNGTDIFTYTITDGNGSEDTASVNISVVSLNDSPVAIDDDLETAEDTMATTVNVLANDSDVEGDELSIDSFTQPIHGSVIDNGNGTFVYTPNADYHGSDGFTYTVRDGNGGFDTATVRIVISRVNDTPVATNDTVDATEDTPIVMANLLSNDTDVDGDTLSVDSYTQPTHGMVTINGDGTFTYVPAEDYQGQDIFTYTVSDGNGETDIATVIVLVRDPLDGAFPVHLSASGKWRYSFTDATGDDVTVRLMGMPRYGNATATLYFQSNPNGYGFREDLLAVVLSGTNDKVSLKIATKRKALTSVGEIDLGTGSLRSLVAPMVTLTGDGLHGMSGAVGNIRLASLAGGADIVLHGANPKGTRITVSGDLGADDGRSHIVEIADTLASLKVNGWIRNSDVVAHGDIRKIRGSGVAGSTFLAGAEDFDHRPTDGTISLKEAATMGSVKITGKVVDAESNCSVIGAAFCGGKLKRINLPRTLLSGEDTLMIGASNLDQVLDTIRFMDERGNRYSLADGFGLTNVIEVV